MTDRELLEKAARAARLEFEVYHYRYNALELPSGQLWSPLELDGDAFRLMLACDITIFSDDDWINDNDVNTSAKNLDVMGFDWDEDKFDTRAGLIRFAIVSTAAAMHSRGSES